MEIHLALSESESVGGNEPRLDISVNPADAPSPQPLPTEYNQLS